MATFPIEVIARAVVGNGSRVLLARPAGRPWYFLPGGHVELGESVPAALRRELGEELGLTDLRVGDLIAVTETRYTDARGDHHEVNLVFDVVAGEVEATSLEPHIEFRWFERTELRDLEVRPAPIGQVLRTQLDGPRLRLRSEGFEDEPRRQT